MFSLPDHSCHHRHLQGSVLHGWFPTTVLPCSLVPAYPHACWPPDEQWGTLYMFYWSRPGSELLFLLPVTLWLLAVREMNPSVPFYINCPLIGISTTELYQYILYITSSSTLSLTPFFFFRVMAAKESRVIVLVIHEPSLLSLVWNCGFKMCVVIVQS